MKKKKKQDRTCTPSAHLVYEDKGNQCSKILFSEAGDVTDKSWSIYSY